jgi:hypothetical protein
MRARGFFLALALGLAGWVVFFGLAIAARLGVPGVGGPLAENYAAVFFALAVYLMVLTPLLVGASLLAIWRGELSAVGATLLVLAFLGASFALLRLFRPPVPALFPG